MITRENRGWKCMSSSWTPRKYQGAFVGLGLRPGLALSASGALKSMAKISIKASRASPTAISRTSRLGMDDTVSPLVSGASSGERRMTRPFALRTRQKWKPMSKTRTTGITAVWMA